MVFRAAELKPWEYMLVRKSHISGTEIGDGGRFIATQEENVAQKRWYNLRVSGPTLLRSVQDVLPDRPAAEQEPRKQSTPQVGICGGLE